MPTLIINVTFADDSDVDFFRPRFVGACEEVAEVAMNGDPDIGEPARADGVIEVAWEIEDD